jgi:hypothetical protein
MNFNQRNVSHFNTPVTGGLYPIISDISEIDMKDNNIWINNTDNSIVSSSPAAYILGLRTI